MHKRGFTLIELLVVIAIIGILASIVMVSLQGARAKGRDAKRLADIKEIQLALSLYYNDNGMFPFNIYATGSTVPTNAGLSPKYLPVVPTDPSYAATPATCASSPTTQGCYTYVAMGVGVGDGINCNGYINPSNPEPTSYHVGTVLEDLTNSALTQDADAAADANGFGSCSASNGGADFSGLSKGTATGGRCSATDAGTAQPSGTEACYDMTP